MSSQAPISTSRRGDRLAGLVRRAARGSARRPRTVIALWLVFVVGMFAAGTMVGTRSLTGTETGVGESHAADLKTHTAGLHGHATESVLVRSGSPAQTAATAADLERRLRRLPAVLGVHGPSDTPALSKAGGRTVLVQATLRGDPDDAGNHVAPIIAGVQATAAAHPAAHLAQAGEGSYSKATDDVIGKDLSRAEVLSVPLTLIILVLTFGALVAASVPLLLGLTSVMAALGGLALVSHALPMDDSSSSLVVLIGLAVGVDYSLFYIRRERRERREGRSPEAALDAAAATVGRAVLVSGLTVVVALAGLLITGISVFEAMGVATMIVALVAVIGSLTVLPATLALLGDRVDKGRIPLIGRLYARSSGHSRAWSALAGAVTRRPRAAMALALVVLGGLAIPAIGMDTGDSMGRSLPADLPISKAQAEIEHAFPGAPDDAELVVSGTALRSATAHRELVALGQRARKVTRGHGRIGVLVSKDGGTAVVSVPMPNVSSDRAAETVGLLRSDVAPTATRIAPGTSALVAGDAAGATDFTSRLNSSRLKVIGFVLGLAFLLLLAAFRSPALAAAVMGLNLLSVGAAYGLLVAVFQHTWAEGLLGFTSSGTVINWIPLFLFVILFGLSMDYTVLVLERIREARRNGRTAREAAAEGVGATGGTVTSAAVVMVAVFSVFAMLRTLEFKQLGVGLAAAILLDATIVRGLALPAVVALLGERRWRVPGPRRARRARPAEREAVRV